VRQANNRLRAFVFRLMATSAILLLTAVSASSAGAKEVRKNSSLAVARAGKGFICAYDSGAFGCACTKGSPRGQPDYCDGMNDFCNVLGSTMDCPTGSLRCVCHGIAKPPQKGRAWKPDPKQR